MDRNDLKKFAFMGVPYGINFVVGLTQYPNPIQDDPLTYPEYRMANFRTYSVSGFDSTASVIGNVSDSEGQNYEIYISN